MTFRRILGPRSGSVPAASGSVTGPYASSFTPTDLIKTQLHCHTSASFDGSILPANMVANYVSAGYGALALTDHDLVTDQPAGADFPIQANELTTTGQHIISINSDYVRGSTTAAQALVDGVTGNGGQCHVAHPLWHTGMSQAELVALDGHMGFEIHTGHCMTGVGHNPVTFPGFAVTQWDDVLSTGKRTGVWGFAVDDLHSVGSYDTYDMGCVKAFVESSTTSDVINSLTSGYFVADVSNFGVTPGYPVRGGSDVSLTCVGATQIQAWGKTGLLSYADNDNLTVAYPFDGGAGFMRFVAIGDYTEPWSSISDRWAAVDGTWAISSGTLAVSSDATQRRFILRRHRQGDFSARTDIKLSNSGTDGASLLFNVLNSNYYYLVRIGQSTLAGYNNKFAIGKTTDNFGTSGLTPLAASSLTATTGIFYTVAVDFVRATGQIRAKVWETGTTEPDWQLSVFDTSWGWGGFGYRANRTCSFDNLYIDGFQTFYQPLFIDPA